MGIALFAARHLAAVELPVLPFEDDSAFRTSISAAWLTETPVKVLENKPFVRKLPGGSSVQVRTESRGNEFTVIVAREWNGSFPGWGPGSWLLTRRMTGEYERLRIFLLNDPNTFIQFRPDEGNPGKTYFDAVIYEAYIVRGLALGLPFERLLTMPLQDILEALDARFPARYFNPEPGRYRDTRDLIRKIRAGLSPLKFTDDGALDENGRYVFIKDLTPQEGIGASGGLNCSGFAKWLVDGMLYPVTSRRLAIPPLKARTAYNASSLTEAYTDSRDPWFGLDWTRNLATEAAKVLRSQALATLDEVEVRSGFFAALIDRNRGTAVRSYPGFVSDTGFGVEGLKPLLYSLAVNEPGHLYLASVNAEMGPKPRMRSHFHIAVLLPYFNEYGVFQTAVFESAEETALNGFIARHRGRMVNLVRIPVEGHFQPEPSAQTTALP